MGGRVGVGRVSPWQAPARPVGQGGEVLSAVHVPRWRFECGVRRNADDDSFLVADHSFDVRAAAIWHWLPGHTPEHAVQHGRRCLEVIVQAGVTVDLYVSQGPVLVEHAEADSLVMPNHLGLRTIGHRRDEDLVVTVHQVVNRGHGRTMLAAVIPEDCEAVVSDELASLLGRHDAAPTRAHRANSLCAESTTIRGPFSASVRFRSADWLSTPR